MTNKSTDHNDVEPVDAQGGGQGGFGRPAEASGLAAAVGGLGAMVAGIDSKEAVAAIIVIVGAIPAVVTLWVANDGLLGLWGKFLRGRRSVPSA